MRKEKQTYYFSVEGETEKWYLDWLQKTINADPQTKYLVKLDSKIQKSPLSRIKQLTITQQTDIIHVFDYESSEEDHQKQFKHMLDQMREAEKIGKSVIYNLGYSNFTFELWMILHKHDCKTGLSHRKQYLTYINQAFKTDFNSLKEYKEEGNFQKILSTLNISHVNDAIRRSKEIMEANQAKGYHPVCYKNYQYYNENPSLSIWESIEQILKDCQLRK